MNILYFIGNGFDINVGLKTRYSDFYEYYKSIDSKNELVANLKKNIAENIVNWSDLELAFGKYTANLNTLEDFDEVYDDIVDHLGDYLEKEEQKFNISNIDLKKFLSHLCTPEMHLAPGDIEEINEYRRGQGQTQSNINIITFNYTRTIERVLENQGMSTAIGTQTNGFPIVLKSIQHIHGYTDARTILGVNDISQVSQENFHTNREILDALIKPSCNHSQRHNVDKTCEKHVSKADFIYIFGSSLGDTDNHWWNLIGQQLRRGIKLIIFSKGEEIKGRFGHKPIRTQRKIKKHFLDRTDLTEDEKQDFENNIYVGVNTGMFSIL